LTDSFSHQLIHLNHTLRLEPVLEAPEVGGIHDKEVVGEADSNQDIIPLLLEVVDDMLEFSDIERQEFLLDAGNPIVGRLNPSTCVSHV
jgi:hypothetical protein